MDIGDLLEASVEDGKITSLRKALLTGIWRRDCGREGGGQMKLRFTARAGKRLCGSAGLRFVRSRRRLDAHAELHRGGAYIV